MLCHSANAIKYTTSSGVVPDHSTGYSGGYSVSPFDALPWAAQLAYSEDVTQGAALPFCEVRAASRLRCWGGLS